MMNTSSLTLLWRVEWVHISGYRAPHYWVEAKAEFRRGHYEEKLSRKNAVKAAKQRSRLSDFPKVWSCRITDVTPEKAERK